MLCNMPWLCPIDVKICYPAQGWEDDLWTQGYLAQAVKQGLVQETTITNSVRRTLLQKMSAGLFDPIEDQTYTKLDIRDLNNTHAQQVAYEAALQGDPPMFYSF